MDVLIIRTVNSQWLKQPCLHCGCFFFFKPPRSSRTFLMLTNMFRFNMRKEVCKSGGCTVCRQQEGHLTCWHQLRAKLWTKQLFSNYFSCKCVFLREKWYPTHVYWLTCCKLHWCSQCSLWRDKNPLLTHNTCQFHDKHKHKGKIIILKDGFCSSCQLLF